MYACIKRQQCVAYCLCNNSAVFVTRPVCRDAVTRFPRIGKLIRRRPTFCGLDVSNWTRRGLRREPRKQKLFRKSESPENREISRPLGNSSRICDGRWHRLFADKIPWTIIYVFYSSTDYGKNLSPNSPSASFALFILRNKSYFYDGAFRR